MNNDQFVARVQAWLSGFYLVCTFIVIMVYELGWANLDTPNKEKTFDSMVNWMTGGALIVLYFWLQRARAGGIPDPTVTTTTQTTSTVTTPTDTASPILAVPPVPAAIPAAPVETGDSAALSPTDGEKK